MSKVQGSVSRGGLAFGLSALVLLGTGCGGAPGMKSATASAPVQQQGSSYEAPMGASASASSDSARSAPAESESMAPSARQGLGTTWGENRESWVQDTAFVRQSSSPLRVFAVHYNDRAGIQAMLGRDSGGWGEIEAPEVSVELRGERGTLPTAHSGSKYYVTGSAGERYSIFVKNQSGRRLEIVASVDGLDVLDGKEASTRSRGYVVSPYETLEIDGFRQSQGSVAAFRFGGVGESYAATKGAARNVGVIGVAVFDEREDRPSAQELRMRNTASPFPASDPRYARPPR